MATIFGLNLPDVSLKVFLLVHFGLLMFAGFGLPAQYVYMNYFVLGMGFWVLTDKTNTTASLFFITFLAATVLGDIFLMIFYSHEINLDGRRKFSTFITCVNLFVKPVTFLYGLTEHKRRGGDSDVSGYTNFDTEVSPTYLPDHIAPPLPGADPSPHLGL